MKETRIDEIYDILTTLTIDLHPDPISQGPHFLTKQISQVRAFTNTAQGLMTEVSRVEQSLRRQLRQQTLEYEMEWDTILSTDKDVARQPHIKDREAMIRHRLRGKHQKLETTKIRLEDTELVKKQIRECITNLRALSREIKQQEKLISDQLSIGGRWGEQSEGIEEVEFGAEEMAAMLSLNPGSEKPTEEETGLSDVGADDVLDNLLGGETLLSNVLGE